MVDLRESFVRMDLSALRQMQTYRWVTISAHSDPSRRFFFKLTKHRRNPVLTRSYISECHGRHAPVPTVPFFLLSRSELHLSPCYRSSQVAKAMFKDRLDPEKSFGYWNRCSFSKILWMNILCQWTIRCTAMHFCPQSSHPIIKYHTVWCSLYSQWIEDTVQSFFPFPTQVALCLYSHLI